MAGQLEYSATPSSNVAINGIGIQGSNTIKNGDDAMRQIMADAATAITRQVPKPAGTYTAVKSDYKQFWRATGAATVNLTAAATLTDGWCLWIKADGGAVLVDPNGSEQINGALTLTIPNGASAFIACTGTAFFAIVSGNVPGPTTSVDNTVPRFDGTAGILQPSSLVINDDGSVMLTGTDPGATGGPDLDAFRDSASPAASDILARMLFNGRDSAANKELYALIQTLLIDPTATSEDAQIDFQTVIAGALASRMKLGAGLIIGSPTGGDPGAGKVNLTEVQQDGVAIRPRILSASVATTSGTSFDFTSIPSWAKEIRIGLVGVSLSGTDDLLIQIGSGSVDTTGYSATCVNTLSPNALATATSTAGFNLVGGDAAGLFNGTVILTLVDAATNTWNVLSTASPTSVRVVIGAGTKSVAGVIDRVRLTRSGSNTFDAGKASITVIG